MWYLLWFVGILLMCSLSTLVLVWLEDVYKRQEKLKRAAAGASAIIAWGTCASWGCVQAARPNPTQATPCLLYTSRWV